VRGKPVLGPRSPSSAIWALATLFVTANRNFASVRKTKRQKNPQQNRHSIRYTDVRKEGGYQPSSRRHANEEKYYLETMATGAAWLDYDRDCWI